MGYLADAIVVEEIAKVSDSLRVAFDMKTMGTAVSILKWGSEELKKKYIPELMAGRPPGCVGITEPYRLMRGPHWRPTVDPDLKQAICRAPKREPFAGYLQIELVELKKGYPAAEIVFIPERMSNIYDRLHGGIILTLIDVTFGAACQTDGTVAAGLNLKRNLCQQPRARCETAG